MLKLNGNTMNMNDDYIQEEDIEDDLKFSIKIVKSNTNSDNIDYGEDQGSIIKLKLKGTIIHGNFQV